MRKNILVIGGTGFIASHLVARLKKQGHFVIAVDLKENEFGFNLADETLVRDAKYYSYNRLFSTYHFDEVYQMACLMGGAGFIFTGDNDAEIMQSVTINTNLLQFLANIDYKGKIFYSSSACVYPEHLQLETTNNGLKESDAYPANPDSNYGWEKLFSERLYMAYAKNYGLDVRIARFHNIFGEYSTYKGGKEKAPAAICRKVAESVNGTEIEIWGSGAQTRSFLYIDECLDGMERMMADKKYDSQFDTPINIGSCEAISINDLARMVIEISGKALGIKNVGSNAIGVNGRNSDNSLCHIELGWEPSQDLRTGMEKLYAWVEKKVVGQAFEDKAVKVATSIIKTAIETLEHTNKVNGTQDDLNITL